MSIERVQRKSGVVWRVRWREHYQPHSRVLGTKRDAELFEADIKRRKRLGQLAQIDARAPDRRRVRPRVVAHPRRTQPHAPHP